MHRQIDAAGGQGFFNFLSEHALGTDFGESLVCNLVASGLEDLDFHFVAALAQPGGDMIGLPESQLRPARTDA